MSGHICCDLDETLAHYNPGQFPEIGAPIAKMVTRIHDLLDRGHEVKIFTARVSEQAETQIPLIEAWCEKYLGVILPITCEKHYETIFYFDDRAKQVLPGTGELVEDLWKEEKALNDKLICENAELKFNLELLTKRLMKYEQV